MRCRAMVPAYPGVRGGGLKDIPAAMLAMQRDGRLTLPPPRGLQGRPNHRLSSDQKPIRQ